MVSSSLHLNPQCRFPSTCAKKGQDAQFLMLCWLQVPEPRRHTSHYHCRLRSNLVRSKGMRSGAMGLQFRLKCSRASTRVQQLVAPTDCRSCHVKVQNFDHHGSSFEGDLFLQIGHHEMEMILLLFPCAERFSWCPF
jgi:hypothetical protein